MGVTWPWRNIVRWVIVDFNAENDLEAWLHQDFRQALTGHIKYCRSDKPLQFFHASVAKNTAHKAIAVVFALFVVPAVFPRLPERPSTPHQDPIWPR